MGRVADMTAAQLRAYRKYRLKMRTDYNTNPSEHARVTAYNRAWRQRNQEVDNIRTRTRYYRRVAREHESCVYMAYSPSDPSFVKIGQTCVPTLRMKFFKNTKTRLHLPHDAVYYYKQKVDKENRIKLEKTLLKFMRENYVGKGKHYCNEIFYINQVTEDFERIKEVLRNMAADLEDDA